MFYHPDAYYLGFRDVIAAWLVCIAVATTGFAYAEVSAALEDRVGKIQTPVQAAPRIEICEIRGAPVKMPPG
jgi:hypothetical protein